MGVLMLFFHIKRGCPESQNDFLDSLFVFNMMRLKSQDEHNCQRLRHNYVKLEQNFSRVFGEPDNCGNHLMQQ
ncbi:hypothetical protein [Sporosarcina koreensis]|uniref:Uncharacterized protein n=1 Tax=Sporosarcina koreensis TaxID=334735 RepID=A0ABW0TSE2_9BACL